MSQFRQLTSSVDETKRVLGTLTSLLHYPHDLKELSMTHLKMIMEGGRDCRCFSHIHPGQSCLVYALYKLRRQSKSGLKIALLFVALPAILQNIRKLKDPETQKMILEKFVRCFLYITLFMATPTMFYCCLSHLGLPMAHPAVPTATFFLGGLIAHRVERPVRHIALLGYLVPKAIETLALMLDRKSILKQKEWHLHLIAQFAWALIAFGTIKR